MKLHQDMEAFKQLVEITAEHFGLNPAIVEKDYWVTYALYNLSQSGVNTRGYAVFKGGTSLTKCYKDLKRFSEDIDVALLKGDMTRSAVKTKIKKIETAMKGDLTEVEENCIKHGDYRQTEFEYKSLFSFDLKELYPRIRFEIVSFTHPVPFEEKVVNSFIRDYLINQRLDDVLVEYCLDSFTLNVLAIERTMIEKLVSIVRMSYDNTYDELVLKTRHLYDLHFTFPLLKDFYTNEIDFKKMVILVKESEGVSRFKDQYPYDFKWHKAPIIHAFESAKVKSAYQHNFGEEFVYGILPPYEDVKETIKLIVDFMREYDI